MQSEDNSGSKSLILNNKIMVDSNVKETQHNDNDNNFPLNVTTYMVNCSAAPDHCTRHYTSVGIFRVSLYFILKAALSSSDSGTRGKRPSFLRAHDTWFQNVLHCL